MSEARSHEPRMQAEHDTPTVTNAFGKVITVDILERGEGGYIELCGVTCFGCPLDETLTAGLDYDAPAEDEPRTLVELLKDHQCSMFYGCDD